MFIKLFCVFVLGWKSRFDILNSRLNLYRQWFVSQRREIKLMKKQNRYLRTKIRTIVRAHEDFVFALL